MANIQPQIDDIRNARYGRDVRESIATGLEAMNTESSDAYSAAITAQTSATASAQQASQSATNASNYANSASQSATNAQNASQGVQTALTQAQQASALAKASETAAKTSETNAKASETASKTSETNAKTSETNALAYSQSAQSASSSAQSASSSAQASASAASNSQTASANSAQNAKNSEEAARQWAQQASSIVNIDTMTPSKNGIGRPDGTTITVDQFGVFKAAGIATHESKQIASNNGVHGQRVLDGKLQHWDEGLSQWITDIEEVKVDGTTITKDENGVIHSAQTYELPTATATRLGGVKVGSGFNVGPDGTIKATGGATIDFDESLELLFLKDASGVVISQTHIEAGGASSIIHVDTHESSWKANEGVLVEIFDDTSDYQGHFDENGDFFHKVSFLGDHIVRVTDVDSKTYEKTVNVSAIGQVVYVYIDKVQDGKTATPINDVATWLSCYEGGSAYSYTTLAEVLGDSVLLSSILADDNANDYLVRSTGFASTLCANESAMTYIGLNDYCANTLLDNDTWLNAICNSTYFEKVLNEKVPTMTSDTTPYGVASSSGGVASGHNAFYAFDGRNDTWWAIDGGSGGRCSYMFTNKIRVVKIAVYPYNATFAGLSKVQSSDDGISWSDVDSINVSTGFAMYNINNKNHHKYWGLYCSRSSHFRIQFYGRREVV